MDHNRPFEANFRKSEKLCTCPLKLKSDFKISKTLNRNLTLNIL